MKSSVVSEVEEASNQPGQRSPTLILRGGVKLIERVAINFMRIRQSGHLFATPFFRFPVGGVWPLLLV